MAFLAESGGPATSAERRPPISLWRLDVNPDWSRFYLNGFCYVCSCFASGRCLSRRCLDFTPLTIAISRLRLTNDGNGGEWGFVLGASARAHAESWEGIPCRLFHRSLG